MKPHRFLSLAFAVVLLITLFLNSILVVRAESESSTDLFSANLRFERLAVEDGLPHATVLSVLQDKQGFMWFATANGVSRYDGYTFSTFRHDIDNPNSLSNNNTFALIESRDGLIWIGTDPGGLNIFDPKTGNFKLYTKDENDPNSLADNSIWSLMEAKDGRIWIGTRGGLSILDRKTGTFKNYLANPDNPHALAEAVIYRIYQDHSGTIWLGTRGGLHRYNPETDDFTVFKNDPKNSQSISHNNVWSMLEDREGVFWVGTRGGGLNKFDRETGKFTAYRNTPNDPKTLSNDRIWNLFEDKSGHFWILTENGGLNLFDRKKEVFRSFQNNPNDSSTVSNNDLYWITEDTSGVIWITSRYGGVNKLYPSLQRFGLYRSIPGDPNSLSSNNVYSVLSEENGLIWIGTFGGGLNRYERSTKRMTVFRNDPNDPTTISNNKIQNIYRDQKGILWLATSGGGLNRLDPVTGKFTAYKSNPGTEDTLGSNFLTMIKPAGNDRLWIGTLGFGLDLFNTKSGLMEKEYKYDVNNSNSLTEDTVYDLAIEKSGKVWIATARGGLELLDPNTGIFTHHRNNLKDPNTILDDAVFAIYLDEVSGMVWAGTSNGLSGLDLSTQQWHNFTTKDGLPSDTVVGIQPGSSNDLWISTGKGISHFSIAKESFENFSVRDGLQGDLFEIASSSLGPDGEIFFGGSNGVTFFRPDQIAKNPYLAPVVFTDFQLFNQSIPVGSEILPGPIEKTEKITLKHDQSVITIKFAALSYQLPLKNLFQYKMDGFDKEWSPPRTKNEVTYTNLPSGKYTFMVRAANNDGVWNTDATRKLEITIQPPWWNTWWFLSIAGLSGLFLIYAVIQLRISNVHARNIELENRVNERTQELEESQKQLNLANSELKSQLDAITILEKEVRDLAIHDALTGLYNRHYLSERLQAEYSRAKRGKHPISFLLIDIDHFKDVNDTYGHQAGDHALTLVSSVLKSHIRQSDIACRYGGEEFMVILPDTTAELALQKAEVLRKSLSDKVMNFEDKQFQITLSIGIAVFPEHGENNDLILSRADAALYSAKESGRNKVVLYSEKG
jgi:diguanylate cyclase (GGDEF)-like protein